MKKQVVVSIFLAVSVVNYLPAIGGAFMEGGYGYNSDQNVGLGYVLDSKGSYIGIGAGFVIGIEELSVSVSCGINVDFLMSPEMGFVRGEERYEVQNLADAASLRFMPYMAFSKNVIPDWLYLGMGLGYSDTGLYFGMRPLIYDREYTSYHLSSKAITPVVFLRAYTAGSLYFSINYEADIVVSGKLRRLAGDPLAGFDNVDDSKDISGVHHRARLVIGFVL